MPVRIKQGPKGWRREQTNMDIICVWHLLTFYKWGVCFSDTNQETSLYMHVYFVSCWQTRTAVFDSLFPESDVVVLVVVHPRPTWTEAIVNNCWALHKFYRLTHPVIKDPPRSSIWHFNVNRHICVLLREFRSQHTCVGIPFSVVFMCSHLVGISSSSKGN